MGKCSIPKCAKIQDLDLFKSMLIEMIARLSHIHYDPKKEKYYIYGGKNLPNDCVEFENEDNQNVIKEYIPKFREIIKGDNNWFHKRHSPHIATTHFKYFLKILTKEKLQIQIARYAPCKTYMINKFFLPPIEL